MASAWGSAWKMPEAQVSAPAQPSMQDLMDEALALKLYEEECRALEKEINPEYFAHAAAFGSAREDTHKEIYGADSVFVDDEDEHDVDGAPSSSRLALQQITSSSSRARPAVSKPAASASHSTAKNLKTRQYDRDLGIDDLKGAGKGFTALRESHRRALKSEKNGVTGGRVEAEQFSTIEGVLDERTTRILQKMINRGELDEVHGCVQTGKEAHVFHAVGLGCVPETDEDWAAAEPRELAVKVFKTTLNEFSNRHEYVTGDRRFDLNFQKKDMRRQLKHWTEKEYRNLCRAAKSGVKAPTPFTFKEHVLLMEFLGAGDGWPSPTLKDLTLSPAQQVQLYADILEATRVLFQVARLVHGDLSEYNILVHEGRAWLIDFGQAVDRSHPDTETYLRRDLRTVTRFFERAGLDEATNEEPGLLSEELAFEFVVAESERHVDELLASYAPLRELLREKQPENMPVGVDDEDDGEDEERASEESGTEEHEQGPSVDARVDVPEKNELPVA